MFVYYFPEITPGWAGSRTGLLQRTFVIAGVRLFIGRNAECSSRHPNQQRQSTEGTNALNDSDEAAEGQKIMSV